MFTIKKIQNILILMLSLLLLSACDTYGVARLPPIYLYVYNANLKSYSLTVYSISTAEQSATDLPPSQWVMINSNNTVGWGVFTIYGISNMTFEINTLYAKAIKLATYDGYSRMFYLVLQGEIIYIIPENLKNNIQCLDIENMVYLGKVIKIEGSKPKERTAQGG